MAGLEDDGVSSEDSYTEYTEQDTSLHFIQRQHEDQDSSKMWPMMEHLTTYEHDSRVTDASGSHHYSSLDHGHIRLLRITSDRSSEQIACELQHFLLTEELKFHALSYQWGAAPSGCTILLNGQLFEIRKNIWRFLHQAHKLDLFHGKWFWIDALCIDQANNEERTQQVAYMRVIFSRAERVVAWLGATHNHSDQVIAHLNSRSISTSDNKHKSSRIWHGDMGLWIARLCHRTYWTRLWIFQELLLASDLLVLCGDSYMPWMVFNNLLRSVYTTSSVRLSSDFNFKHTKSSPAMSMAKLINDYTRAQTLWTLLMGTKHLVCSDPKDKVYALLGIAEGASTGIEADYMKPISAILNEVLRHHHQRQKPRSLDEVTQQCQELSSLTQGSSHSTSTDTMFELPVFEAAPKYPFALPGSHVSLWWSLHHDHAAVQELLIGAGVVNRPAVEAAATLSINIGSSNVHMLLGCQLEDPSLLRNVSSWVYENFARAITTGNSAAGKTLLDTWLLGASDTDCPSYIGELLYRAATASPFNIHVLSALLNMKPDTIDGTYAGDPVLVTCILNRCVPECIRLLLAATNNVNAICTQSMEIHVPSRMARWRGMGPLPEVYRGSTILHWTVAVVEAHTVAMVLGDARVNVNARNNVHQTPLHLACYHTNNHYILSLLLSHTETDINAQDTAGRTPLYIATTLNNGEVAELLLNHDNINLNLRDSKGTAPLHLASGGIYYRLLGLLLKHDNVRVNLQDSGGRTALHMASRSDVPSNVEELLSHHRINANLQDFEGNTPLHLACNLNNLEVVKLLTSHDNTNSKLRNSEGQTPLDVASEQGHSEIVKALLNHNYTHSRWWHRSKCSTQA